MKLMIFVQKKMLSQVHMELRERFQSNCSSQSNNLTIIIPTQLFVSFCFFQLETCFPSQAMFKTSTF